ncbi:hypothetical protein J6590_015859 [Homalodisca vitripennis]|nr:hypothetical protein J6590_015859 [Homalodisca vitripennis]
MYLRSNIVPVLSPLASRPAECELDKKNAEESAEEMDTKTLSKEAYGSSFVRLSEGKLYADVMGEINQKAKPDKRGTVIKGPRKTHAGDFLIELEEATGSKSAFSADLQSILGANVTFRILESKSTRELRELHKLKIRQRRWKFLPWVPVMLQNFNPRAKSRLGVASTGAVAATSAAAGPQGQYMHRVLRPLVVSRFEGRTGQCFHLPPSRVIIQTIPDITFSSEGISYRITDWYVCDDYYSNDHQAILYRSSAGKKIQTLILLLCLDAGMSFVWP